MLRTLAIAATIVVMGGPAFAAEHEQAPKAQCMPLVKLKSAFDAKTNFASLTPGQFHFAEGLYVGSPATPPGMPPGDGALLATHEHDKTGILIWTRGPLACAPVPIPEGLMKMIDSIKTGALDADGNEL